MPCERGAGLGTAPPPLTRSAGHCRGGRDEKGGMEERQTEKMKEAGRVILDFLCYNMDVITTLHILGDTVLSELFQQC